MSNVTISLPDDLQSFVDKQVHECGYTDCGEFIRHLIRKERDRQHLRALVLEGAASSQAVVADDEFFDRLFRRLDAAERE